MAKYTIPTTREAVAMRMNHPALLENVPPAADAIVLAAEIALVRYAPERVRALMAVQRKR